MKPLVYVAGPVTGNPWGCVRQATDAFAWLRDAGCVPFLPQLSVLHEMVDPQPYEEWLTYDLDVLEHCHALVRLPGESSGADREVAWAREHGLPVLELAPHESIGKMPWGAWSAWLDDARTRVALDATHRAT